MVMQTFTSTEYLKIDIASNFGLDKKSWDERIAWVDQNEADLESFSKTAEEPALFFAGVKAYRVAKEGHPIGYPISLDATASGAQILAILEGCRKSAILCNVIDTGNREDLYTNIYASMCARLGGAGKISRDDAKEAIMTSLYSSVAVPKRIFGEGAQLDVFHQTMLEEAPGIWELNESLLHLWQPDLESHDWVLPDNFHVKVKVMDDEVEDIQFLNKPYEVFHKVNRPTPSGRSLGANLVHSIDGMIVREITRRCGFSNAAYVKAVETVLTTNSHSKTCGRENTSNCKMVKKLSQLHKESGFLSARVIDYIDEDSIHFVDANALWKLLSSMPDKRFDVISVHDCFRVHPNYGNDLRKQYNQILSEVAGSSMLAYLVKQIAPYAVVEKTADISEDVLNANYALS